LSEDNKFRALLLVRTSFVEKRILKVKSTFPGNYFEGPLIE